MGERSSGADDFLILVTLGSCRRWAAATYFVYHIGMAWDDKHKRVAIKAIGAVESSMNYGAINYNDPITVGMGQWYGTRAAAILRRMHDENPASWVDIAPSIHNDVIGVSSSSTWWTTRYLTRAEGNSLVPVLIANSAIQNDQIVRDLDSYVDTARSVGIDPDANTKTFIMFCVAYHQGPKYALQVVTQVGGGATLEQFRDGCLNNGVLGRYPNRYNTAYTIIANMDSSGVGDIGGSGSDNTPGNELGDTIRKGNIHYVERRNDGILYIHTVEGLVRALPVADDYWLVGERNSGTVGAGGDNSTISGGSAMQAAIVKWCVDRIDKFAYAQSPGRLDPDNSGLTDCSGLVWRAYKDVAGVEIGTWTGTQKDNGREIAAGSGPMPTSIVEQLQPADLIVMMWNAGFQHVEMSMGGYRHIGHGGPDNGPDIGENIQTYVTDTAWWTVRRIAE